MSTPSWPPPIGARSLPGARSRSRWRGRLEHLHHLGLGEGFDNPIGFVAHTANGEDGWFGWPKDDLHEKLRDDWALAATLEERKAVARKLQENAWNYVPMALLGQWAPPVARRANLKGFIPIPAHVPFWNVEKV